MLTNDQMNITVLPGSNLALKTSLELEISNSIQANLPDQVLDSSHKISGQASPRDNYQALALRSSSSKDLETLDSLLKDLAATKTEDHPSPSNPTPSPSQALSSSNPHHSSSSPAPSSHSLDRSSSLALSSHSLDRSSSPALSSSNPALSSNNPDSSSNPAPSPLLAILKEATLVLWRDQTSCNSQRASKVVPRTRALEALIHAPRSLASEGPYRITLKDLDPRFLKDQDPREDSASQNRDLELTSTEILRWSRTTPLLQACILSHKDNSLTLLPSLLHLAASRFPLATNLPTVFPQRTMVYKDQRALRPPQQPKTTTSERAMSMAPPLYLLSDLVHEPILTTI